MNLTDMHIMFRQYGQQAGLQNVRSILPEQIDRFINAAISDIVNRATQSSTMTTVRLGGVNNAKLDEINALRTLYKVQEVLLVGSPIKNEIGIEHREVENNDVIVKYDTTVRLSDYRYPFYGATLTRTRRQIDKFSTTFERLGLKDLYLLHGLSVIYASCSYPIDDNLVDVSLDNLTDFDVDDVILDYISNPYDVRIVEEGFIGNVMNDFSLHPTIASPVAVVHEDNVDLYIDKVRTNVLDNGLIPYVLNVSYIKKPAVVKFNERNPEDNVDCDLPEYLHNELVKTAVELYQQSITQQIVSDATRLQRAQRLQTEQNNQQQ